jgi:hypothetical protein
VEFSQVLTSAEFLAASPDAGGAIDRAAQDKDGNIHVVYPAARPGSEGVDLHYQRFDRESGTVGAAVPLPSDTPFNFSPSLLTDSDGRVHVTWVGISANQEENQVRYARLTGRGSALELGLAFPVGIAKPFSRLVQSPDGSKLWLVYPELDGDAWRYSVQASTDAGETWHFEARFDCGMSCNDRLIEVAVNPESGRLVWAWLGRFANGERVLVRTWTATDGWSSEPVVVNDGAEGTLSGLQVLDLGTEVVLVWESARLNDRRVWLDRSRDGGQSWGLDISLPLEESFAGVFFVRLDDGTGALAGWYSPPPRPHFSTRLWLRRLGPDGFGDPKEIWNGEVQMVEVIPIQGRNVALLVGILQVGLTSQKLAVLPLGSAGSPEWIDLLSEGASFDALMTGSSLLDGRFLVGARRSLPIPGMRGATLGNPSVVLFEGIEPTSQGNPTSGTAKPVESDVGGG